MIEILPLGPDTRSKPPRNGIRWQFVHGADAAEFGADAPFADIWPEFLDEEGRTIPVDTDLFGALTAIMHIIFADRISYHVGRLVEGSTFEMREGAKQSPLGRS